MSWSTWTEEGIGFDVSEAKNVLAFLKNHVKSIENEDIREYIENANELNVEKIIPEMADSLSEIISDIIYCETGKAFAWFTPSEEGYEYIMFQRKFAWEMAEWEKNIKTSEDIKSILKPYTDELGVEIDMYAEVAYCG